jgi:hypothetical protein
MKLKSVPNNRCREYVQRREPFQGSNLWGTWHTSTIVESKGKFYVVYSYGHHFPIYIYDEATEQWFANKDKFSQSTSKHQSQARPVWEGTELQWLNTGCMVMLSTLGYNEFAKRRVLEGVL